MSWKNHSQMSKFILLLMQPIAQCSASRQRKEHKVFQLLLKMVPHLTECLMEDSEEECMVIADLVGVCLF
jgi:hypothetical protein